MRDDRRRLAGQGPQEYPGPSSVDTLMQSIQTQESGGFRDPVNVRNERTGAHGLFQIMPNNWGPWSKEVFGKEVERTAENQRIVAEAKLSEYTEKFGVEGAAVAWYAGPGRAREWLRNPENPWFDRRHGKINPKTGLRQEPSVREYVASVTGRMGQGAPVQPPQADMGPPVPQGYRPPELGSQAVGQRMQPIQHIEAPAPVELPPAPTALRQAPSVAPQQQAPSHVEPPAPIQMPSSPALMQRAPSVAPQQQVAQPQEPLPTAEDIFSYLDQLEAGGQAQQEPLPTAEDIFSYLDQLEAEQQPQWQTGLPEGSEGPPLPEGYEFPPTDHRAQGRQAAQQMGPIQSRVAALFHGGGSGSFGLGTPIYAARDYMESRIDPRREALSYGESLERTRGMREGLRDRHTGIYYTGMAGGVAGSAVATKGAGAVPVLGRAANVFALQKGQTARNIGRMMMVGGTAGGVTAGMEEGMGAAPVGAALGAAAGPALVGTGVGARGLFRHTVGNRQYAENLLTKAGASETVRRRMGIDPDGPVIRALARKWKEDPKETAAWYNRYTAANPNHKPALAELIGARTSEEIGVLASSGVGSKMASTFRTASDEIGQKRAEMLGQAYKRGGPTTTLVAEEAALGAMPARASQVVGRRAGRTVGEVEGFRDIQMDKVIKKIGGHHVPVTDAMHEVITHPDVMTVLPGPLRNRVRNLLEAGEELGAVTIPVRVWDAIRQEMSKRAGPGAGMEYARLRNKVTDYVSDRVPEYGQAMQKYIQRSQVAEGIGLGSVLASQPREFAAKLRTAGGGTAGQARSPGARRMQQVGARQDARRRLADALESNPEATMERMARDSGFRKSIRAALSPREADELERLARQQGYYLDAIEGAKVGRGVGRLGETSEFAAAVDEAAKVPGSADALPMAARGFLSDKAREGPVHAASVAEGITINQGAKDRILKALGVTEGGKVIEASEVAARGASALINIAPASSEAAITNAALARDVQTLIGAGVISLTGKSSAAMKASTAQSLIMRLRILPGTAKKMADMLVDADKAPQAIKRLIDMGVAQEQILQIYRQAAISAGILAGGES